MTEHIYFFVPMRRRGEVVNLHSAMDCGGLKSSVRARGNMQLMQGTKEFARTFSNPRQGYVRFCGQERCKEAEARR